MPGLRLGGGRASHDIQLRLHWLRRGGDRHEPDDGLPDVARSGRRRLLRRRLRLPLNEEPLPPLVVSGIEKFNRGEFYECHDDLEDAWRDETRQIRYLYQGILQVGVGFHHQRNGNWKGAVGLIRNGVERLRDFEPEAMGVDVGKFIRESEECLEELEGLGRERVREFDASRIPRVEWEER
jgi:predicted metal-dependent hydrolase